MKKYPQFVQVDNIKYKINTNYLTALECEKVAMDTNISDYERGLSIIYLLFGEKGLNARSHYKRLIKLAVKYLQCGESEPENDEKPDMDFEQDMWLIELSFESDFNIKLSKKKYMHWWGFYRHLNGLSENCVLNRVRELRTYDISKIKDQKEKRKLEKAKKRYALKEREVKLTDKQKENVENFYRLTGIKRKE